MHRQRERARFDARTRVQAIQHIGLFQLIGPMKFERLEDGLLIVAMLRQSRCRTGYSHIYYFAPFTRASSAA